MGTFWQEEGEREKTDKVYVLLSQGKQKRCQPKWKVRKEGKTGNAVKYEGRQRHSHGVCGKGGVGGGGGGGGNRWCRER